MRKGTLKKALALALTGAVLVGAFAGCGAKKDSGDKKETKKIVIGASPSPHADILKVAKKELKKEGYELEIKEYSDYVQPNTALESGDLDANYSQHKPYLDDFNKQKKTHLVSAGTIHYEPFGIFPGKTKTLKALKNGATVAVPNDTTNEARALLLLQDNGIITLKDGAGLTATVTDIEENPYNLDIVELEAAQVARVVDETAYVVLNGNYALAAGFSVAKDALAYEKSDSEAAKTYVNIIAVKEGNEENPGVQALVDVLKSDEIRNYINETYDGAVIPYDDSEAEAESETETETGSEADSETAAETETETETAAE